MKRILPLLMIVVACRQESKPAVDRAAFERDIAAYRKTRVERLTRPEGWLSVVALLPLHDGVNDVELPSKPPVKARMTLQRSEEHTSELQSPCNLVCRLLLD